MSDYYLSAKDIKCYNSSTYSECSKSWMNLKNNDTTRVATTITNAYDAHILTTGYLKEGASKSYEFRIWMDSSTTAEEVDSMNKTLVK